MEAENSRKLTSTYFSATILSFVLGSSGIVLSIVPILIPNTAKQSFSPPEIAEIVVVGISTFCTSAACLYLVYFKRKADLEVRYRFERTSIAASILHFLKRNPEKYMLFMLIAFGLGSILCSVVKLAAGDAKDIILNIFKVISICFQLVFFCYYSGDAPQAIPSAGYDYSIACLIGLQAWTWVSKVFKTLWPKESHTHFHNQALALTEEYFEPFDVEFTTIAVGSLFNIWHSKKQQEETLKEDTDGTGSGLPSL